MVHERKCARRIAAEGKFKSRGGPSGGRSPYTPEEVTRIFASSKVRFTGDGIETLTQIANLVEDPNAAVAYVAPIVIIILSLMTITHTIVNLGKD